MSQYPSPMADSIRIHERIKNTPVPGLSLTLENVLARPIDIYLPEPNQPLDRLDLLIHFHSPTFYGQSWRQMVIKDTTRGPCIWHIKSAQVYLVKHKDGKAYCPIPTDRTYWLMVAHNRQTGETKYFVSNAPVKEKLEILLEIAFSRWHVEKWFERAKQECGFGAFEVRTYTSLIRHWLASRLAMYFLADQTHRLRGENPQITLEQVADVANTLAWKLWQKYPHSWKQLQYECQYRQERNEASYASRKKTAKAKSIEFL